MRIVGIDCGSACTGYGVVDSDGRRCRMVAAGVIRSPPKLAFAERLERIHKGLSEAFELYRPDEFAVESVFHAVNAQSALKLAQVRGVALLAAAQFGLPVGEYSPLEVKGSVVGYGRADKRQVQMMVSSLLGLAELITPFDASDALAVAICHANTVPMRAALQGGSTAHG